MLISQRMRITPVKNVIQINSMDDDLRNSLWNALAGFYWNRIDERLFVSSHDFRTLFRNLWLNYFKKPFDSMPHQFKSITQNRYTGRMSCIYDELRQYFFQCYWYEIYDFIEFIAGNYPSPNVNKDFMNTCNYALDRELSAYRFVSGEIAPITSETEIAEIEEAITENISSQSSTHLQAALTFLAESRKNPSVDNFRNSMKESISAVEAMCQSVSETTKTLDKALDEIERRGKIKIHRSLREAFSKLYGYTNDAEGIRHAMKDEPTVLSEDAKFMLIVCSAFINYLKVKSKSAEATL